MLKSGKISKRKSVSILLGIGLFCWGLLWVCAQFYVISMEMERANAYPEHPFYDQSKRSILGQIWNHHHHLIMSFLIVIAGVVLLFRKKNRVDTSISCFDNGNFSFYLVVCKNTCK